MAGAAPELPAAAEYEPRGTIWIAADEEELAEVHAKHATYAGAGIRSFVLIAKELAEEDRICAPGWPARYWCLKMWC